MTWGSLVALFGTLVFCVSFVISEFEELEDWALSAILRLLGMATICLGVLVCTVCPVDEVVRRTCTLHIPRTHPARRTAHTNNLTRLHAAARTIHIAPASHAHSTRASRTTRYATNRTPHFTRPYNAHAGFTPRTWTEAMRKTPRRASYYVAALAQYPSCIRSCTRRIFKMRRG